MEPKFNIDRPKISDEEIQQRKDFDRLVKEFKERSLKQAQGDESWRKNKRIRYRAVIAGVTVICTVTLFALLKKTNQSQAKHETLTTSHSQKQAASTRKPFINAPSDRLKIPYTAYTVNGAKGGSITHRSSTKIKVPAGSFVNKQGQDITGDVTIEYREFHHAADIVVSGIPMAYDSAGTKYNFESAGMFDIRGTHKGEPVFIKPDKQLNIELASTTSENRFNQYFLDTVAGNWQYLKKDQPLALPVEITTSNKEIVKKKAAAPASQPSARLVALKNDIEVILPKRVDSVKVIYIKKVAQLPKPREPFKPAAPTKGRPTFKLDGSYNEFPELAAFDNVIFEVGPENSNYTKEFHTITWTNVTVSQGPDKGKNYYLSLIYRDRQERLVVYPVLTGADLEKAKDMYEEKFVHYEALVEKRQADEKRLLEEMQAKQQAYMTQLKKKQEEYDLEKARMAAKYNMEQQNDLAGSFNNLSNSARATRLFSVSQFGIYNSDCPHALPQGNAVTPIFVLDGNSHVQPEFIYLVDHKNRSVYTLGAQNGFQLNYRPGDDYSVCVFRQNKLYLCGKNAFKQTVESSSNKFMLTPLPANSENLVDFKKALEI